MTWQPISEYRPEMGRVIVWLAWPPRPFPQGSWFVAYQMLVAGAPVWVTEADSVPCETTGRRATHFIAPREPA